MQIPIYVINNMPEPGRNLAADACMGRTQLSPCIYNFSTRTIRASRNAMPAWYFFHAEPLISRFSLEKNITLLQQLWQTVLMWNLYPIFISLNQLAVKITPAESFLWMHLHQFQYLFTISSTAEGPELEDDELISMYELFKCPIAGPSGFIRSTRLWMGLRSDRVHSFWRRCVGWILTVFGVDVIWGPISSYWECGIRGVLQWEIVRIWFHG